MNHTTKTAPPSSVSVSSKTAPTPARSITDLQARLAPKIQRITDHSLAETLTDYCALQCFMQHHVFAVWDFLCLLKALYRRLACTDILWHPPIDAKAAHYLHQILGEEEGDTGLTPNHTPISHFEWYLRAMTQCGADICGIMHLQNWLQTHKTTADWVDSAPEMRAYRSVQHALIHPVIPIASRVFVCSTFRLINQSLPALAAAFVFGREGITSGLFLRVMGNAQLLPKQALSARLFVQYLQRHVSLDQDEHFPQALKILERLCQTDPKKWQAAESGAEQALEARFVFLNSIQKAILRKNETVPVMI